MSGICDTCKREHCHIAIDGIKLCDFYERGETRYERFFGTPEKAARTICRQLKHGNICVCDGCPVKPTNQECNSEYDALLEWLRSDA